MASFSVLRRSQTALDFFFGSRRDSSGVSIVGSTRVKICTKGEMQRCRINAKSHDRRKAHHLLIVGHAGQQVEHFVVWHTVRSHQPSGELNDAPHEQQNANRHEMQHQTGGKQQQSRQPAQFGHRKVERAACGAKE